MADFCQFMRIFMESINVGPAYMWDWVGRVQGWDGWLQKIKQGSKTTHMVVSMHNYIRSYCIRCSYKKLGSKMDFSLCVISAQTVTDYGCNKSLCTKTLAASRKLW